MGIYRFLLAALVVLFHFGGLGWIVGRIAVFAFYCISGYLIFQVLDRVYLDEPRGVPRFFLNRFVRLIPLYLLYTLLTLGMVRWLGPEAIVDPAGRRILQGVDGESLALLVESATFDPIAHVVSSMPVLEFTPDLIPQGWSIGVEITFYLIAPLVVLTTRRRTWRVGAWIVAGLLLFLWGVRTAGTDLEVFQTVVYKNAVASAFVFFVGGALYYVRRRWGQPLPFVAVAVPLLAWLALVTIPALHLGGASSRSARVFTEYLWLTLLLAGIVALAQVKKLRVFDTNAGNLCYGIYLNHFFVAGLLLRAGTVPYLGLPGTMTFGFAVLLGSTALAYVTYRVVERPFDRVRARVRGDVSPLPTMAVPRAWRTQLGALAVAAALVLLVSPVGRAVAYVSQSAIEELPPSPAFNIRWRPDVSDGTRHELEAELGLTALGPVERDESRRTWSYSLRSPTPDRVRALLEHRAVEDTAGIDAERLEISQ
ncbi:MAG TPA: acyltransferase [Vicinamibacterales bacterium]|nr:acyltransferase [Vicinamibacterales bacterium]